jgi:disulfide oxidoreductase YuzD
MIKTKNILLATIVLLLCGFTFYQTLTIRPGEGVGPFTINKTTIKEIRATLGKQKFTTMEWLAPHCGQKYPYKVLNYRDKGILFKFYEDNPHDTDKILNIELYGKCEAMTDKQIAVNLSRRSDIYKAYGRPKQTEDTIKWFEYPNIGITFEFSAFNKSNPTDTVQTIYIYEPIIEK